MSSVEAFPASEYPLNLLNSYFRILFFSRLHLLLNVLLLPLCFGARGVSLMSYLSPAWMQYRFDFSKLSTQIVAFVMSALYWLGPKYFDRVEWLALTSYQISDRPFNTHFTIVEPSSSATAHHA